MSTDTTKKKVTIVVPVYADWPSLAECVESLKKHAASRHKVVFVNDCGPEVELIEKNLKQAIAGTDYQYFRNKQNLGFVGACNRAALELDKTTNDILLLNSDTKVTEGFLEEMLQVLYASGDHGTVSPRSNNATLATIPLSAANQKGINAQESFKIFQLIKKKLPKYTEVPVAHGFCMLIRRPLITKYGLFDTAFGRGYGEEVDFCMRITKQGYKCLLSNWSYVFHLEARSFTPETKKKLLEVNNQIIWKRYPDYRQNVRDYMGQARAFESAAERAAGVKQHKGVRSRVKDLVKRNRHLYRLASILRRRDRS